MNSRQLMRAYYLATALFFLLDITFGVNIRISFFENSPVLKWTYYAMCMGLAGLMSWRPALTVLISVAESLVVVSALTLSMGMRTMRISEAVLEGGFVTIEEVFNFVISGGIAYFAWVRGMHELRGGR